MSVYIYKIKVSFQNLFNQKFIMILYAYRTVEQYQLQRLSHFFSLESQPTTGQHVKNTCLSAVGFFDMLFWKVPMSFFIKIMCWSSYFKWYF